MSQQLVAMTSFWTDKVRLCIIQTTKVYVTPFSQVTEEHAYKEGEFRQGGNLSDIKAEKSDPLATGS